MSKRWIKAGSIDQTIDIFVMDSTSTTGGGLTGLVFNSAGLTCYYRKGATGTPTALTLATQTVGGAHSDGGFVAVDGTNMPGVYRLDLSDTIVNTAGMVTIYLRGATNMVPVVLEIEVVSVDIYDTVRFGLTALPNAAAEAAGGLITRGTGAGQITLASGAVTVGTNNDKTGYSLTQAFPTNFSSLAITVGGAVTAGTVSDKTGYSLASPQTFNLTGNITGNLSGSVGSVTGAVGSVTGNVGGNVVGSVGSVSNSNSIVTNLLTWDPTTEAGTPGSVADILVGIGTNVTTLLSRVTATLFSGITSLGQWLGLIAGKQTGDSTARTEMRATGAGSGTYDETTDSLQAIRDRGDAAWTGGGGSTSVYANAPYTLRAGGQFPSGVVDIVVGTILTLDLYVTDRDGLPLSLEGTPTVTVGVRNATSGATVGSDQTATIEFDRGGICSVDTVSAWSATAGTYRISASIDYGDDVVVAGPLEMIVRSR